jgi:signal transduction histidine kinase
VVRSEAFVTVSDQEPARPPHPERRIARARNYLSRTAIAGFDWGAAAFRSLALGQHAASANFPPRRAVVSPHVMRTVRAVVAATAIASAVITAIVTLIRHRAYPWQADHLALETSASLIALLACFLVFARIRRRTTLDELMLAAALAVLALSNLFLVTIPIMAGWGPDALTVWAAPSARSAGALLLALAAFSPDRRLRRPGTMLAAGAGGMTTALLLTTILVHVFVRRSPPAATAPVAQYALELTMAALFGLAAAGFLRRGRRVGDDFFGWLAIAAALALVSRVNYVLYYITDSQSPYSGDAFLLASYVAVFLGALWEIRSYWLERSKAAVVEERRRIACELHDGLAQELAYVARNLDSLRGSADKDALARLHRAVERARLESRRAISGLTAPSDQPFEVALAEAVTEVAQRYHVELDVKLTQDIRLSAPRREALMRIACEAVTNAARHSGVSRVNLGLERDGSGVRLRVSDEGRGFDISAPSSGFGLISMHDRAQSVGAELLVSSTPGHGSHVEVAL